MSESFGAHRDDRHNERGSSTVKFIIVLAVVGILIYIDRIASQRKHLFSHKLEAAVSEDNF